MNVSHEQHLKRNKRNQRKEVEVSPSQQLVKIRFLVKKQQPNTKETVKLTKKELTMLQELPIRMMKHLRKNTYN